MTHLGVLHVIPSLDEDMGGSVQAALLMSEALCTIGVDSRLVATVGPDDRLAYIDEEFSQISYEVFARRTPRHYYRSPSLRRRLRQGASEFHVLHVHGVFNFPAAYALTTAGQSRFACVLSPHGQLDPYDLTRHRVGKSLYGAAFLRRVLGNVDFAVVTSELEGDALHTFGVPIRRQTIGLPVRSPGVGSGPRLRARLKIPSDALVVLFLGRIHPKKRIDIILESVARVRAAVPGLHVLIVGDGDERYVTQMRRLAANLGLAAITTWAGTLRGEDKADALDATNIFVLPSENENFGITVVEALLAGVPTIVSDQVHLQRVLTENGLAAVCQPTVDSCAQALLTLAANPVSLQSVTENIRSVAGSLFSPEGVAQRLRETYLSAVAEHR